MRIVEVVYVVEVAMESEEQWRFVSLRVVLAQRIRVSQRILQAQCMNTIHNSANVADSAARCKHLATLGDTRQISTLGDTRQVSTLGDTTVAKWFIQSAPPASNLHVLPQQPLRRFLDTEEGYEARAKQVNTKSSILHVPVASC